MIISLNAFVRKVFSKGGTGWDGANITHGDMGAESPEANLSGEAGGIDHFKGRTKVEVQHVDS